MKVQALAAAAALTVIVAMAAIFSAVTAGGFGTQQPDSFLPTQAGTQTTEADTGAGQLTTQVGVESVVPHGVTEPTVYEGQFEDEAWEEYDGDEDEEREHEHDEDERHEEERYEEEEEHLSPPANEAIAAPSIGESGEQGDDDDGDGGHGTVGSIAKAEYVASAPVSAQVWYREDDDVDHEHEEHEEDDDDDETWSHSGHDSHTNG